MRRGLPSPWVRVAPTRDADILPDLDQCAQKPIAFLDAIYLERVREHTGDLRLKGRILPRPRRPARGILSLPDALAVGE